MAQDPKLLKYAAAMRREATPFEIILWRHLSRSQLGHKFRRQHVVGQYILDFYCPAKALAVEVDGETHDAAEMATRDAELSVSCAFILHFSNLDIAHNIDGVLTRIVDVLNSLPDRWPHPNPSPEGEGLDMPS